jgi:hypothetical protein
VDVIGEQVKEPWDITGEESFERTLDDLNIGLAHHVSLV